MGHVSHTQAYHRQPHAPTYAPYKHLASFMAGQQNDSLFCTSTRHQNMSTRCRLDYTASISLTHRQKIRPTTPCSAVLLSVHNTAMARWCRIVSSRREPGPQETKPETLQYCVALRISTTNSVDLIDTQSCSGNHNFNRQDLRGVDSSEQPEGSEEPRESQKPQSGSLSLLLSSKYVCDVPFAVGALTILC